MAIRYYGIAFGGDQEQDVTIASSTTSSDVELAVDDSNAPPDGALRKQLTIKALAALIEAVREDNTGGSAS